MLSYFPFSKCFMATPLSMLKLTYSIALNHFSLATLVSFPVTEYYCTRHWSNYI